LDLQVLPSTQELTQWESTLSSWEHPNLYNFCHLSWPAEKQRTD
jgi:hypothetical protein